MFPTIPAADTQLYALETRLGAGAHPWPLSTGADRSAGSLARLLPDCLELLDVEDATVVANDTAGGLLLLSLATGHPALGRVGRLVLTNCDNYDQFPPDALRKASALSRALPRLARALLRLQLRSATARRKIVSTVAASGLDHERVESFFDRPVLLIWGESCDFFPMTDAERLASEFPRATLVPVPEAKTWVPIENPAAVADAIIKFVPTPVP